MSVPSPFSGKQAGPLAAVVLLALAPWFAHGTVINTNAATDFISGPGAQSATNQWQYLQANAARSSAALLGDWDTGGNEVVPGFGQWDNNGGPGGNDHYPFVQLTGAGGPHGLFGSDISGDSLIIHPGWDGDGPDSVVFVAWYNDTGHTVSLDFDATFTLEEGQNSNGIEYFIHRSLTGDGRYLEFANGVLPGGIEDANHNVVGAGVELLAGELFYFGVDNFAAYQWDHTRLDLNITATFDESAGVPLTGGIALLLIGLAAGSYRHRRH